MTKFGVEYFLIPFIIIQTFKLIPPAAFCLSQLQKSHFYSKPFTPFFL